MQVRWSPPPAWALAAVLALGALLRFVTLGRESYWLDELATLDATRVQWSQLVEVLARWDNHPPLHYAMIKAWGSLVGRDEAALRTLGAALGTLSVAFAYLCSRDITRDMERGAPSRGSVAGLWAAGLVAVLPLGVRLAREVRMYSLLECASLASTWLFVRLVCSARRDGDAAQTSRGARLLDLAGYVLATTAALYTHVYATLLLGAHGAAAVALALAGRLSGRGALRVGAALALSTAAYLPWIPVARARVAVVGRGFWITQPDWDWPTLWGGSHTHGWGHRAGSLFAFAMLAAAVVAAARGLRTRSAGVFIAAAVVLSQTALPICVAPFYRPVFTVKYAIAAASVVAVLAGVALGSLRARRGAALGLAMVGMGLVATQITVLATVLNEDFRAAGAHATRVCTAQGLPLVAQRYAPMYQQYVPARCVVRDGSVLAREAGDAEAQRLVAGLAERGEFWLLAVHPSWLDPGVERALAPRWRVAETVRWHRASAFRWVPRSPTATPAGQ